MLEISWRESQPSARSMTVRNRRRIGRRQKAPCQQCRQRAAVARRRARGIFSLERPGPVGGLIARQNPGRSHQDCAIFNPPTRDRGVQGRRENNAGQPLVVEWPFTAVMLPIRRPDKPASGFRQRRLAAQGNQLVTLDRVPAPHLRYCDKSSNGSHATSVQPHCSGTRRPWLPPKLVYVGRQCRPTSAAST